MSDIVMAHSSIDSFLIQMSGYTLSDLTPPQLGKLLDHFELNDKTDMIQGKEVYRIINNEWTHLKTLNLYDLILVVNELKEQDTKK